jgi:hypothetical protein
MATTDFRLAPGMYLDIPHAVYHSDPCELPSLSSHIANIVVNKSPGHAALMHPRLDGKRTESSAAMETGSILHGLLLGGGQDLVEVDAKDWRTNAAKEERDNAAKEGKIAILKDKFQRILAASELVRKYLPFDLSTAKTEVTCIWDSNGCPCRCRIDALMTDWWVWDLKFCEDATVSAADRNIAGSGYHLQAAANINAIESLVPEQAGRVHFGLAFIEWENPQIGIKRVEIRGQLLDVGNQRWKRAKATWAQCLARKSFPGYNTAIVEAECPAWIANDEFAMQMQIAGKEPF